MRHLHIFDPQLLDVGGHYLNHDTQCVREMQRRGLGVTVYGRVGCKVECAGIKPEQIFTRDIFQEAATDGHVWAMENFHNINQAFLGDLCRIDNARFTADDLVYFPNLLQNQMYAIAMWLGRFPEGQRPAVAIMLRYLNHAMDYVQGRAHNDLIALYYRYAGRALYSVQRRTVLCADTRELAVAYQKITGLPVVELPNPMDVSQLLAATGNRTPNPKPVVVYQGHTSRLRGFQFLPEVIDRCHKAGLRPKFVVQLQNVQSYDHLEAVVERLKQYPAEDVELVNGALSSSDYLSLLSRADVVMLPYSPNFYGHGSSGVFTEAAIAGKVVVVSQGTVPARQGREFQLGVVTASQWAPASFGDAVVTALRNLPALQKQAQANAGRYQKESSSQNYWEKLISAYASLPSVQVGAAA